MPDDPTSYRAEPNGEFADRLERELLQRLADPGSAAQPDGVIGTVTILVSDVDDGSPTGPPVADLAPESDLDPRAKRRRRLVVAAAATIIVIAAAVLAYRSGDDTTDIVPAGPGPKATTPPSPGRLNAFPPEGAIPSTPETGVLLADLPLIPVFVYEDGRVISSRSIEGGFRNWYEQRLTPEGLELVKAEIRDGGQLDHSPAFAPGDWVYFDGDRALVTKTQIDPNLSWLPAGAWQDPKPTLFGPSKYLVCLGGTGDASAILARLPAAAAEPFARATPSEGGPWAWPNGPCFDLATDDARKIAAALHAAGAGQPGIGNPLSYGFGHHEKGDWVGDEISFTAYLPHGNPVICCAG